MGFGKDGKGVIIVEKRSVSLGTLGVDTGIFIGTKLVTLERFRMLKAEIDCVIDALTDAEGGGLVLYLADGDLALSEIEFAIETSGPLGPNDRVLEETANRFVIRAGATIQDSALAVGSLRVRDKMTGGPICILKPRWTFARTKSWNWVLYNHGQALTTGAVANIMVKNFGVWVT